MSITHSSRRRLVAVFCGGFCGTLARYVLSTLLQGWLGKAWPYDILLINITGALILAFVTNLADATLLIGPARRLFINVGFLGAYTTFSSFALGDVLLFSNGHWLPAFLYLFASIMGGILAVLCGDWLGQRFTLLMSRPIAQPETLSSLSASYQALSTADNTSNDNLDSQATSASPPL
jgi:fluoride exporter